MNPELAIDLFKTTLMFALYTAAPFLIVLLVVGLIASVFQSVTSLQEQTLTFAPKLVALAALLLLLTPWLLRTLMEFTATMIQRIGTIAN